jgi:hypothetical protein
MSMSLSVRVTRAALTITMLVGGAAAFIVLGAIGRDGAISGEGMQEAQNYLLQFYLPLLAIVAAFYFAERRTRAAADRGGASAEAFALAFLIVALWVMLPPIIFALSDSYNAAIRTIDSVRLYGNSLSSGAVAFFFAKTSA